MASLVDSVSSGSVETYAGDEFTSGSLSAIFHYSARTAATTVAAALPTPPQQPPPPPPPPTVASSVLDHQPFFDPISYLDSTTPSWPRALVDSASGADFPSLCKPHPDEGAGFVDTLDDLAGTAPRSSKKRTRSSRQTPTTVLSTDISNFRAMVQQFTGAPSSPFSAVVSSAAASSSSLLGGSRFDLFSSSAGAAFGSSSSPGPPPFLRRRPFPQLKFVRVRSASTANSTINHRPSADNIEVPSHDLGFGSSMRNLQSLLCASSSTTPPATPATASCSTKVHISTLAPPVEFQPELSDGRKNHGSYSRRLTD